MTRGVASENFRYNSLVCYKKRFPRSCAITGFYFWAVASDIIYRNIENSR